MEVKIHSGKLKVKVNYRDQSFKKSFVKEEKTVTLYNFTMTPIKGYYGTATISMIA